MATHIHRFTATDRQFALKPGEGADSVHTNPTYAYAVCELHTDGPHMGVGLSFTLGGGNNLVCKALCCWLKNCAVVK